MVEIFELIFDMLMEDSPFSWGGFRLRGAAIYLKTMKKRLVHYQGFIWRLGKQEGLDMRSCIKSTELGIDIKRF